MTAGPAARLVRVYNRGALAVAVAAMSTIVVVMMVQVFWRYVLNSSTIWAEELCRYLLILMTFLLIGPAFERGEMVSVQFFMQRLPARAAKAVMVPVYLCVIGFLVAVSYVGHKFALLNSNYPMPAIDFIMSSLTGRRINGALSMYWLYMLIPAGCLLLAAHIALAMLRAARAALGLGGAR